MRFIPPDDMEQITDSILSEAKMPTTWQGSVTRTDIDTLIEFEYGLSIEWKNIGHFAPDDVVLAAIVPRHKLIYLNETKEELFMEKMGTMNFSKAHELGHWVLHVIEQKEYQQLSFSEQDTFFCRSSYKKPPEETQADMFAASILMPKNIICGAIGELKHSGKVTFPDLYNLKDQFEVSMSALTSRIKQLNLLYISNDKKIYFSEADALGQVTLF